MTTGTGAHGVISVLILKLRELHWLKVLLWSWNSSRMADIKKSKISIDLKLTIGVSSKIL